MIILLSCTVQGCEKKSLYVPEDAKFEKNIIAMDTYMTLTAYGEDAEQGLEQAADRIQEIEQVFSVTDETSEIYQINHRTAQEMEVSEECAKVLEQALEISTQTGGAFDVTMYPVVREWGFTTGKYRVPGEEEIQELLSKTGYEKLSLNHRTLTLQEGMEIDFGGIAKGYTGDEAVAALKKAGVEHAIVNLGGNIQALGDRPDGTAWNVGIRDPIQSEEMFGTLQVSNQAVVTSGAYERYFEENGVVYGHIMNPDTGRPADNGILSVTVIGDKGIICDALSTAFFVLGLEGTTEYWQTYGGCEIILVTEEKQVYVTEGIQDKFQLTGDYGEVICIKKE